MTPSSAHIVCFAPYTDWSIHSARQVTLLHALAQRGATVSYVTCDGVFSDCDLFQEATGAKHGRQANSCLICQASVASRLAAWSMPYRWLGTWLTTSDRTDVGQWLAGLAPEDYPEAELNGWEIGAWVRSSVRTHLRCNSLDMSSEKTAATYASYLYSGALAALGLERLFQEEKPDLQLLFNGRMAPTRIALELARKKNIRTVVEERSAVAGQMILFENVNCLDLTHVDRLWDDWHDTPLTTDEIEAVANVLEDRRAGGKGEVSVFSQGAQDTMTVRTELGLKSDRPAWVLFTSSVDEIADKENVDGIFPGQQAWIEATLDYMTRHPDIQLVIRVHPNVAGATALGQNQEDLAYYEALAAEAPDNVRIVQPGDKISSYTLADLCDVALVWYSTIGIEAAAMGRRVVRGGGYLLERRDFISAPDSPESYPALLDRMQSRPDPENLLDIAVDAWRFAYVWFLRRTVAFPWVRQPEWYIGEPNWQSPADLTLGNDSALDTLCEVVLGNKPLHRAPAAQRDGSTETERETIRQHIAAFQTTGAAP